VEEPADEEVHQAQRSYHLVADKTKESQLRLCEMPGVEAEPALNGLVDAGTQDEFSSPHFRESALPAGHCRVGGIGLTK
jgi:hypothetical protein